jgi:hypothetical protein
VRRDGIEVLMGSPKKGVATFRRLEWDHLVVAKLGQNSRDRCDVTVSHAVGVLVGLETRD